MLGTAPFGSGQPSPDNDPLDPFSAANLNAVGHPELKPLRRPLNPVTENRIGDADAVASPLAQERLNQLRGNRAPRLAEQPNAVPETAMPNPEIAITQQEEGHATAFADDRAAAQYSAVPGHAAPVVAHLGHIPGNEAELLAAAPEEQAEYFVTVADQHGIAHAFTKMRQMRLDSPLLVDLVHDRLVTLIRSHRADFKELR